MANRNLHRPGIHDKSPAVRRKNQASADTKEDETDSVSPDNRPQTRSGGGRGNQLYPELPDRHLTDTEDEEGESSFEHTSDEQARRHSPKPGARRRTGRGPAVPEAAQEEEQAQEQSSSGVRILILVVGVISIALGVYLYMYIKFNQDQTPVKPPSLKTEVDHYALFIPKFNDLKRQFPSQSDRFWRIVGSPLRRVLKANESEYPAILLVGVPAHGAKTASCFSKKLVEKVNAVYSNKAEFYVDVNDVLMPSPAHTKLELDNKMKQALTPGNGVVVDHIERLPAEGALLLHGYCDGDNAPFKTSVIVLVFHTEKDFGSLDDRTFENHLTELWQAGLGPDEMPALRARVANSVIIINPETSLVC